jgi:ABC-type transport system involved in multi-copper enzyme maturation permease subunit
VGPDGEAVTDGFYFVHKALDGNGSITVRVTSLTGVIPSDTGARDGPGTQSGVVPWAKAGLIVKANTTQGSAYAAIMITGSHGVRMQYNYTHDKAGSPDAVSAASPRWLRLTRSGDLVTGYESSDGTHWSRVGTARLAGLSATVQAGLFVTSPDLQVTEQGLSGASSTSGPSQATAVFDDVSLQGQAQSAAWSREQVGGHTGGGPQRADGAVEEPGGGFTMTGAGDIAPSVAGPDGDTVERSLVGAFAALIVLIVVATMFITAEYRRGLIRTTLAANPRRGRVLAAKAVVIAGVTFSAGLAGSASAFLLVEHLRHSHGDFVLPVSWLTELRVVGGTAALLSVAAVLALAVGIVLRRSAGTVTVVVVLIVLPYILSISVLPIGVAQWLLRITPAAAFAIQQSTPQYAQVDSAYIPATGFYPLPPWAGFGVLCAWTVAALGLAFVLLRRRDA